jgi:hypothetical protein
MQEPAELKSKRLTAQHLKIEAVFANYIAQINKLLLEKNTQNTFGGTLGQR